MVISSKKGCINLSDLQTNPIPFEDAEVWMDNGGLFELFEVGEEIVGEIPLARLAEFQPLISSPWPEAAGLCESDVEEALAANRLEKRPYSLPDEEGDAPWDKHRHAERIAYLVTNPSDDPIIIEFTEPEGPGLELTDGWHRLAAAQYSRRPTIPISISGFVDSSVMALGAICRSFQFLENQTMSVAQ